MVNDKAKEIALMKMIHISYEFLNFFCMCLSKLTSVMDYMLRYWLIIEISFIIC